MGKAQAKEAVIVPASEVVPINEARMLWREVGGRSGARDVTGDPILFEAFHNRIEALILSRLAWDKAAAELEEEDKEATLGKRP